MEITRPIRRNLSRRQQRLQDSARQIVIRSPVPLTADERHGLMSSKELDRAFWKLKHGNRTTAAIKVIDGAARAVGFSDPWIVKAYSMVGIEL